MAKQHRVHPSERFPAKPRKDGRFQKRINGTLHYFGKDGDRKAALAEYQRVKDQLYAGLPVNRAAKGNYANASVKDLANRYVHDIRGEIKSHKQYTKYLIEFSRFFRGRKWATLTTDDFTAYGKYLRSKYAPSSYNRMRAVILAMFAHADDQDWIERAPKFGRGFRRIPPSEFRTQRKYRLLSSEDINALLGVSTWQMFAMLLLGLNGGFGPSDCATLPWSAVVMDKGKERIDFPRAKNKIPRSFPLWPETAEALRRVRAKRPNDSLVFRTKFGRPWHITAISHEFAKVVKRCELPMEKGVGIYAARHTFATLANEVRDTDARRHIMGRKLPNLDDIYVETLFMERLKAVTDHVRTRLAIPEIIGDVFVLGWDGTGRE